MRPKYRIVSRKKPNIVSNENKNVSLKGVQDPCDKKVRVGFGKNITDIWLLCQKNVIEHVQREYTPRGKAL